MTTHDIKSMQLYSHVDRIYNDLRAAGIKDNTPLTVDSLLPFDQLHYFGTDAVDKGIEFAQIDQNSKVLDIGSGFGGPARYLADRTSCKVTAVELQSDLDTVAQSLTERCGLSDSIEHVCADIHETDLGQQKYHSIVSWLAVYHIPEHASLYKKLHNSLRKGGKIYFEDLYRQGEFDSESQYQIEHLLYGKHLQTKEHYISDLKDAGFTDITFDDMTNQWQAFVTKRLEEFRAARTDKINIHGESVVQALDGFYQTITDLLSGGTLRGVCVTATAA